jgi:hypothetical protein
MNSYDENRMLCDVIEEQHLFVTVCVSDYVFFNNHPTDIGVKVHEKMETKKSISDEFFRIKDDIKATSLERAIMLDKFKNCIDNISSPAIQVYMNIKDNEKEYRALTYYWKIDANPKNIISDIMKDDFIDKLTCYNKINLYITLNKIFDKKLDGYYGTVKWYSDYKEETSRRLQYFSKIELEQLKAELSCQSMKVQRLRLDGNHKELEEAIKELERLRCLVDRSK